MSAYFESLNRRVSTPPVASAPAAGARACGVRPAPTRVAVRRLSPGAVPRAYATLRERLMVAAQGKTLKSLVFAGCDGGEGCTQVAREFAESLASAGLNVLLVDADIRTAGLTSQHRRARRGPDGARAREGRAAGHAVGTGTSHGGPESEGTYRQGDVPSVAGAGTLA